MLVNLAAALPASSLTTLGLIGPIGTMEMVVLAVLGVLIFGKRLPEVGRSIGKGIVEFKKGLSGVDDDADTSAPPRQVEAPRPQPRLEAHTAAPPADAEPLASHAPEPAVERPA